MIDQHGRDIRYLRISVTELCNLRCRYCMPAEGVCKKSHSEMLTEEEILMAARAAASLGIEKIRLTGGEPLVKRNIVSICEGVAAISGIREVCLTTNATLLAPMAKDLRAAGVSRLNLSVDTLDAEKYRYITRLGELENFYQGLEAALAAGFDKIKLNAVLIGGFNDDEIVSLANLTKKYPVDMRFIELMPMLNHPDFGPEAFISYERVLEALPEAVAQEADGGVAKLYRLPNALGNIGLISPVNAHFCAACNRVRLTSDGKIKPCLHSGVEYPIKGLDEDAMRAVFREAIFNKPSWHGDLDRDHMSQAGRNMNQIGG